ncbi:zinc finger CCCH domain-containing protein 18-like [Paramacrobiotus metropolitanus]|uniref:zinc finger CCCH domain-containing protein 18-like n=1 Tax=Paramacrobiotus metropolitanus TaxID=2943436 RepID=UPI0024456863|nr:zinc finger CCCH domain-containing protein 18-like [Paramacrobiotus metropolitanus]XP_055343660.1 zinc finger CCCH domain-containing protein 18-like [Paramacrobiotus metropolitanus]XP_055343661.1 zinc finger CCCH domain-containing protein 18-like [Paramacrobiotus metropolitanus]
MAATDSDASLGSAGENDANTAAELEPVKNGMHGTDSRKPEALSKGKTKEESDEEGEASDDGEIDTSTEKNNGEEGELEEGEVDDDEDGGGQQKNSVCKYFYKGQCTWGSHCRFMHPGSVDKGNYSLFENAPAKNPPPEPVHSLKPPGPPLMVPQPGVRPPMVLPPRRRNSPQLIPPVLPLRMPLPGVLPPRLPMDFFPPIPEPPRAETMWERGLRQAKTLAQAAARKRDAIEDKMHGLDEKFDPEFEDEHFGETNYAFPEQQQPQQRGFPSFPMRPDFDPMQRNRRMNDFGRFERRRSPPIDNRENMMDRRPREPMMRQRGADEWHDPWMRSAGGGGGGRNRPVQRWNNRNRSKSESHSKSRSRSRSGSPSQKKSLNSRSNSKDKQARKRSGSASSSMRAKQRERDRRNATRQRAPSGSPISSSHSSLSRSSSPKSPAAPQKAGRASSHESDARARRSPGSRLSQQERASSRKHYQADERNKASPSLSSVSSRNHEEDDGPRTPPPDPEEGDEESPREEVQRFGYDRDEVDRKRTARSRSKRSPSQSPVSDDDNDERRPNQEASVDVDQPVKKKIKKGHKPVKLTLNNKTERRAANAAFGAVEEEMDEDSAVQLNVKPRAQSNISERDQDRSSPLSEAEEDSSPKRAPVVAPSGSEEKANKREELLRQLRAVEEAIARKKATKVAD